MPPAQAKSAPHHDEREIRSANCLILHSALCERFCEQFFEPRYWLARDSAQRLGAGRGATWRVSSAAGDWVLRHYRRGGAVARVSGDRYIWTGHARGRSIAEWRLLARMRARGLPVPRPVAARLVRHGITYTADLITEYLSGTRTLGERLAAGDLDEVALAAVGRCVRRFHDAGVWHADLNAHNILLDEQCNVHLIDFDRARMRRGGRWKAGNLQRLRRSLDKLAAQAGAGSFDEAHWRCVITAYGQPAQ